MRKDIWKKEKTWLHYAGYALAIIALGYIAYSVYYFVSSGEHVEEFEVCEGERCIKTFHVHAHLNVELCGEKILLPLEHGALEGPHTHKERNLMHFHERLPYDSKTGQLLENAPLILETFMNEFDIRFNEKCIADYCNGDSCPSGAAGTVRMYVNDQPNSEFEKYVWNDKDVITITFE